MKNRKITLITFIAVFSVIGAAIIFISAASSDDTVFDPASSDSQRSGVVVSSDGSAHDGNFVMFRAQTEPPESGQIGGPTILTQNTSIPGVLPDPLDANPWNNSNTVAVDCPEYPADCAPSIKQAMTRNSVRPLKLTIGDPSQQKTYRFGSQVRWESDVSLEGVGNPILERPSDGGQGYMFGISRVKNASFRNFEINMANCREGNAIFFDGARLVNGDDKENIHVSYIRLFNGDYFWRTTVNRWWLKPNNPAECDLMRLAGGGKNLHIHHIAASSMQKFVHVHTGPVENFFIYDNWVERTYRGYYTQFGTASANNLHIKGNRFINIARGHHNYDQGSGFNVIELAGSDTGGSARSRNVFIEDNRFEVNTHMGPSENFPDSGPRTSGCQATILKSFLTLQSTDNFIVQNNTFSQDSDSPAVKKFHANNGIVLGSQLRNGRVTGNTLTNIKGSPEVIGNQPASVTVQNTINNANIPHDCV